jgi:hypothetical protein
MLNSPVKFQDSQIVMDRMKNDSMTLRKHSSIPEVDMDATITAIMIDDDILKALGSVDGRTATISIEGNNSGMQVSHGGMLAAEGYGIAPDQVNTYSVVSMNGPAASRSYIDNDYKDSSLKSLKETVGKYAQSPSVLEGAQRKEILNAAMVLVAVTAKVDPVQAGIYCKHVDILFNEMMQDSAVKIEDLQEVQANIQVEASFDNVLYQGKNFTNILENMDSEISLSIKEKVKEMADPEVDDSPSPG